MKNKHNEKSIMISAQEAAEVARFIRTTESCEGTLAKLLGVVSQRMYAGKMLADVTGISISEMNQYVLEERGYVFYMRGDRVMMSWAPQEIREEEIEQDEAERAEKERQRYEEWGERELARMEGEEDDDDDNDENDDDDDDEY